MSEARIRGLAQSQSKIFGGSPISTIRRRDNPQSESKIFTPLRYQHKPLTYARAQYEKTTIFLGKDQVDSPSPPRNLSASSPAGKKTGQCSSTKYLIGNERSTFYRKAVNEKLEVPSFEPKYNSDSAFERKQREFNSGFSPKKKEEEEEQDREKLTARERKLQDRVSVFDNTKHIVQRVLKENVKPEIYDPKSRKGENLSSDVFFERKIHEYKRPLEVRENEEIRKKNHMFSDLFGANLSPTREKVKERLVPTEAFYTANGRQNLEYDPRGQITKNLSSQIEIGDSPSKTQRNRPKTPQSYQPELRNFTQSNPVVSSTAQAQLYDLELSNVPGKMTAAVLKELCGGIHIVSLSLDIDNFTGDCKGTGQLKLRTNEPADLARLVSIFKSRSIQVQQKQENLGRKSNYAEISNVHWHHPYDYKKSSTPMGARESKMKNLESSFFGPQVKYPSRPTESFNNELSAQILWKNTKNASKNLY